jgi:ribosomal-protein-alanine N-acetyltransferase
LGDPVSRLLVAEGALQDERSDVLGYAVLYVVADQAELANLAVAPAVRGRGVGRALLESVVALARELGVRELFLEVRESNSVAQRLYRSVGFAPIALRRGYYESPVEDALVMVLHLGEAVRSEHA